MCRTSPDVEFEFYGTVTDSKLLEAIKSSEFSDRIAYRGYSNDVSETLSGFDIFFYPLRPGHYGTGEQVLLEAMAAGLAIVAMQGVAESAIVAHGRSGLLAEREADLTPHLLSLVRSASLRKDFGLAAAERVRQDFSASNAQAKFSDLYRRAVEGGRRRSARRPLELTNDPRFSTGAGNFLASMAELAPVFVATVSPDQVIKRDAVAEILTYSSAFKSMTRGTPRHYLAHFPDDGSLQYWASLFEA